MRRPAVGIGHRSRRSTVVARAGGMRCPGENERVGQRRAAIGWRWRWRVWRGRSDRTSCRRPPLAGRTALLEDHTIAAQTAANIGHRLFHHLRRTAVRNLARTENVSPHGGRRATARHSSIDNLQSEIPAKAGGWLAALDDFRNWLIREAA